MSTNIYISDFRLPRPLSSSFQTQRSLYRPTVITLPSFPCIARNIAACGSEGGLRTPPDEEMSTAYQRSIAAPESFGLPKFTIPQGGNPFNPLLYPGRANMAVGEPSNPQLYRLADKTRDQQHGHQIQKLQHEPSIQARSSYSQAVENGAAMATAEAAVSSLPPVRLSTPASEATANMPRDETQSKNSDTLVYHSLTIPRCVSPNGGNLAELAAQVG